MISYNRLNGNSWLLFIFVVIVAVLSSGCSSSTSSTNQVNPLGAYQAVDNKTGGSPTSGTVTNAGAIDSPIVSTPTDGQSGVNGHTNAPLLDNMHPGWQQSDCLSCHNEASRNPDHNYTNSAQCYLCHGTNGLPGFGDKVPPVIGGVVSNPGPNSVVISWNTDEEALTRLVLRTVEGDRLEFPVSTTYSKSHRYEVNGLISNKNYTFELICTDRNGNRSTSSSFGTLSFTTLAPVSTTTTTTPTTPTTPVDNFFSAVSVTAQDSFSIKYVFTPALQSKCHVYIVDAETSKLVKDGLFSGNQPDHSIVGPYTEIVSGLAASKKYKTYIIATESSGGKTHTSAKYTVTTPSF